MDYLSTFLLGIIFGLIISVLLTTYFSQKGSLSAIKEDISKIKKEMEF